MFSKPAQGVGKISLEKVNAGKNRSRAVAQLGQYLEKNLLAYVAAASAGILSASPANAEIVYTPSNTPMAVAQENQGPALTQLDLNNDGTPDFTFLMLSTLGFHSTTFSATTTRFKFFLKIDPSRKGNQPMQGQQPLAASAVSAGATIGSKQKFADRGLYLRFKSFQPDGSRTSGTWQNVEYAYVGLKFTINSEVHYGWARVKLPYPGEVKYPSISGYAYESTANAPIVAGQTGGTFQQNTKAAASASLGMLAIGASGTNLWRTPGSVKPAQ